jgi:DNA-binding CsgD family transcriptional regulator
MARMQIPPLPRAPGLPPTEQHRIDALIHPLQSVQRVPDLKLDAEIGARLSLVAPLAHVMAVFTDFGATGLDRAGSRLHGTTPADAQGIYANLIGERDPLVARATQEWRPIVGTLDEHAAWLRAQVRNPDTVIAWLNRTAVAAAAPIAVLPARGWLSKGGVFAFAADRAAPAAERDREVFALFYAAQRLAVALELRARPFIAELLELRFAAREAQVLKAGLKGAGDEEIAADLQLTVDAIRYYFKKIKHKVPQGISHLRPRELARVLHHLGKL